jgi:hypothetical protein
MGIGRGHKGMSYAIPTKDRKLNTLPLIDIHRYVIEFMYYAEFYDELKFQLTPIGCGLAGYKPEQIAPMFKNSPPNVVLPPEFLAVLNNDTN